MIALGIDIGGSGVKGALVDLDAGELASDRHRIPTPQPAIPEAVTETILAIVEHHNWDGPVGITVPGIVANGVVSLAANIGPTWTDFPAGARFSEVLGRPVAVLNDADAAGIAEIRYGNHGTAKGVVLALTFGTGIGSALFIDEHLVPNVEFGYLEFKGGIAEHYAAAQLVKRDAIDLSEWAKRVDSLLLHFDRILSPDLMIIGGGISKRFNKFSKYFTTETRVVPARLRNNAGIVGAAMAATAETP